MSQQIPYHRSHRLASLFAVGDGVCGQWRPDELADVLRHQLDAPLTPDLAGLERGAADPADPGGSDQLPGQLPGQAAAPGSFAELLCHPDPPIRLLVLAKRFFKAGEQRGDGALPAEVARLLYYAAIVAAGLRHGVRVTELSPEVVGNGARWALARSWLDDRLRGLFEEWMVRYASGPAGEGPTSRPMKAGSAHQAH